MAGTQSAAVDDEHPVTGALAMQQDELTTLYRRAFSEFGMSALLSRRPVCVPTPADVLAIIRRRLAPQPQPDDRSASASGNDGTAWHQCSGDCQVSRRFPAHFCPKQEVHVILL